MTFDFVSVQIFTSIFALNGHIRVHGGSFYPKPLPPSGLPGRLTGFSGNSTLSSYGVAPPNSRGNKVPTTETRSQQQLELAKALLELPTQRSPARGGVNYHTPSPKPSPKGRSSPGVRKKLSSASPGEREGFYPCNRCGRYSIFVKYGTSP